MLYLTNRCFLADSVGATLVLAGSIAISAGYLSTHFLSANASDRLRRVSIPVVDHEFVFFYLNASFVHVWVGCLVDLTRLPHVLDTG